MSRYIPRRQTDMTELLFVFPQLIKRNLEIFSYIKFKDNLTRIRGEFPRRRTDMTNQIVDFHIQLIRKLKNFHISCILKIRAVQAKEILADLTNLVVAPRNKLNYLMLENYYHENPTCTRGVLPRRKTDMKIIVVDYTD